MKATSSLINMTAWRFPTNFAVCVQLWLSLQISPGIQDRSKDWTDGCNKLLNVQLLVYLYNSHSKPGISKPREQFNN